MFNNKHSILVLGATGRVGGATLHELQRRGMQNIVAGVRDPGKARGRLSHDVELRHLDLDNASTLPVALAGIAAAMLVTGYSVDMLVQSQRFLHAAKDAGVRHTNHLGASGNPTNEVAHWGWHRYVEALIEQLGFEYTHLRPEAYMQNITDFGWQDGTKLTSYIDDARWSWIDARDVGAMAAAALVDPSRFRNRKIPMGTTRGRCRRSRISSPSISRSVSMCGFASQRCFWQRASPLEEMNPTCRASHASSN